MPDYRRNRVPGGTYFFTVNLLDRDSRLLTDHIDVLRQAVRDTRARAPFHIDAWAVLPEHMHCVWTLPPGDADYSGRWRSVKKSFSKAIEPGERRSSVRRARGERGIWQRRFWEHTIRDEVDYANHVDYVHFNPVKHGLVPEPAAWPYSSFHRAVAAGLYPADWECKGLPDADWGERRRGRCTRHAIARRWRMALRLCALRLLCSTAHRTQNRLQPDTVSTCYVLDRSLRHGDNRCMGEIGAQVKGIALVTLSAVGWSMAGLFTRLVAADQWAIVGWRGVFSALAVLVYLAWKERGHVTRSLASVGWPGLLAATVSTLASLAYIAALLFTSVANVVVIYATMPFVTAGLAWVLLRERPASATLFASGAAVIGVVVTVGGVDSRTALAGIVLALMMTIGMGLLTVLSRWARGISMIPATCISAVQLAVVGALATPLLAVSAHDIVVLAAFGVVQAAALACYLEGARHLVASRCALLSTLDVPLAPLWVLLVVGEVPALATVIGGVIVLAAVVWDIARSSEEAPAPA